MVVKKLGRVTCSIDIGAGRNVKKHIDHMTQCSKPSDMSTLLPLLGADAAIVEIF